MRLVTERLALRPVLEADFDVAATFFRDPVQSAVDGGPPPGATGSAALAAFAIAESDAIWARRDYGPLTILFRDAFVGFCGLRPDPAADASDVSAPPLLFYAVARPFWRYGIGFEAASACQVWAFEHLGFERLNAVVRADNRASRALLAKLGFLETGQRQAFGAELLGYAACAEPAVARQSAA